LSVHGTCKASHCYQGLSCFYPSLSGRETTKRVYTTIMNTYATVVLAAGKGTRMRSTLPKVLHPLAGSPLLAHVLKAVEAIPATPSFASLAASTTTYRPIVVLGHETAQVKAAFGERCLYALQSEQLGTGDAVLAARHAVDELEPLPQTVLVCYGDTPLVSKDVLARLLVEHHERRATITFLTAFTETASDFGRVVRDENGQVRAIVEVKRATEEQKRIREVNSGVYCFDRAWLWPTLETLPRNPSGEYYLTDVIAIASAQGRTIATVSGSLDETIGVNDRVQLAFAERLLRQRILERHMYAGVTIIDPATTYIDDGVGIGNDTIILPSTMITGNTRIGSQCRIGPGTTIEESTIGDHCIVRNSVLEETTLEDGVSMGPFSHCRPGAYLARNVRMGNFAEVKNSYVGAESDMGAGVVTVNYDGECKHRTIVGDGAFIGSGTMVVAPVTIGEHGRTGAGAVVTKDVPAGALVVGVPARVLRMPESAVDVEDTATEQGKKE
jgi:bifunctional UDP-N-acetylglucosamine pyrophosphorylase/glucosamine-1-phosphate N-acetyltransferase